MAEASLMRTVRFRAGHYRLDRWTEEENRRVFGAAADLALLDKSDTLAAEYEG